MPRSGTTGAPGAACHIRDAGPADVKALSHIQVAAAHAAYAEFSDARALAWVTVDRVEQQLRTVLDEPESHVWLAAHDGEPCGFAVVGPARDADKPGFGELRTLYVSPDHWGWGIGSALHQVALEHLATNWQSAVCWVLTANAHALRFYRNRSWRLEGYTRDDVRTGFPVSEARLIIEFSSEG